MTAPTYQIGDKIRLKTVNQINKLPLKHKPSYIWRSTKQHEFDDLINYNRDFHIVEIVYDVTTDKTWYKLYIPNLENHLMVTDVMVSKLLKPFNHGVYYPLLAEIKKHRILSFEITENGKISKHTIPTKKLCPRINIVNTSNTKHTPILVYWFNYVEIFGNKPYACELDYADLLNLASIKYANEPIRQLYPEIYKINKIKLL